MSSLSGLNALVPSGRYGFVGNADVRKKFRGLLDLYGRPLGLDLLFFGWAPARSPLGGTFTTSVAVTRLAIVVGYACIQSLLVAGLAFLLGVMTDAPLGAVGGAVLLVVVSNILDSISALDPYRQYLPTHYQYSWLDALGPTVVWDDMLRGIGLSLVYAAVFLGAAWVRFQRKDITS